MEIRLCQVFLISDLRWNLKVRFCIELVGIYVSNPNKLSFRIYDVYSVFSLWLKLCFTPQFYCFVAIKINWNIYIYTYIWYDTYVVFKNGEFKLEFQSLSYRQIEVFLASRIVRESFKFQIQLRFENKQLQ